MAYHDSNCVCGDKKLPDTLICEACRTYVASGTQGYCELKVLEDESYPVSYRRHAGIQILAAARRRKRFPLITAN